MGMAPQKVCLVMDNRSLFLLFIALVSIALGSYAWLERSSTESSMLFPEMDTAMIEYIGLRHAEGSCRLQRNGQLWMINQEYEVDAFVFGQLLEVLQSARIRRDVRGREAIDIQEQLSVSGAQVTIAFTHARPLRCTIWGEADDMRSYVGIDDRVLEFSLPGSPSYLAPLFFLREIQWRTRRLFSSSAYTLKSLRISYPRHPEDELYLQVTDRGPIVKGIDKVDSLSLYAYLAQYEVFYTNEYIEEGQVPAYDSLLSAQPLARVWVDDLYASADQQIDVYARPGDPYFLLHEANGSRSLCARKRFRGFLRKKHSFKSKTASNP